MKEKIEQIIDRNAEGNYLLGSTCYAQPSIQLFNCDNLELMAKMGDNSVDVILTDPPYLYLKNQKLERQFNEHKLFSECKRVLVKDGFIVLFGRGVSFYRWNTILADMGFSFKEEVVWDKIFTTSPALRLQRCHETVSIFSKGKGVINRVKIDYVEANHFDLDKMQRDINRISSAINSDSGLKNILDFLKDGNPYTRGVREGSAEVTMANGSTKNSQVEKSMFKMLIEGVNEKSIIRQCYDRYSRIHPTQKPVRLLERLLALVIPKDKESKDITVLDPFGGSFSTMEAVYNMQMKGISCEIDKEYFDLGKERIEKLPPHQTALFD
jgi:site-specific DNA-methyltransferase (adenine-specific)